MSWRNKEKGDLLKHYNTDILDIESDPDIKVIKTKLHFDYP